VKRIGGDKVSDSGKAVSQENSGAMNKWEGESGKAKVVDTKVPKEKNLEPSFCHKCKEYGHLAANCRKGWPVNRGGHGPGNSQGNRKVDLSEYVVPLCATQVEGQCFFCIPNKPSSQCEGEN
jgi:hypothetical protein